MPDEMAKAVEDIAAVLDCKIAIVETLKALGDDIQTKKQSVLDLMGEVTTVQALCRPLQPGETRKAIASRVSAGLAKDKNNFLNVAVALGLALQAAAQTQ